MTALFAALIIVPFLLRWALDTGKVDIPDGRKVHSEAVPRIGGIAIYTAFLFSLVIYVNIPSDIRGIIAGSLLLFVTGLVDDLYGMSPRSKFLGQISGCLVTIAVGHLYVHQLGDLFGLGPIVLPLWFAIPFTVFAVVGVVNAINLIDGLDGLAGGVSVIALAAFFYLGYSAGNPQVMVLCAGLLGALLGFLKYNLYPARVFMGDVGSLVVGFILAFVAISLTQTPGSPVKPVAPLLILGLPIIDTVWVFVRRLIKGQSPFAPDLTHIHHQLLGLGLNHHFTVIAIYGISLFWAAFSVLFHDGPEPLLLVCYVMLSCALYLGLRHVTRNRERCQ